MLQIALIAHALTFFCGDASCVGAGEGLCVGFDVLSISTVVRTLVNLAILPSLETSPNKKLVPIPVKRARAVQRKRVGGHAAVLAVNGGHRPHLRKFQLKSF